MTAHLLSDGILKVYDVFNALTKDADAAHDHKTHHDFLLPRNDYTLKTTADHAGIYYLARRSDILTNTTLAADPAPYRTIGAELIATDAGFNSAREYQEWADQNPTLWGNQNGYLMFSRPESFNLPASSEINLKDINDHYYALHDRVLSKELMIAQAIHIRKFIDHNPAK